ncbi:MAG TPA: tetratricopeptide repeat protein [Pyrinomonadaceae bacterium]|nr:tetratricopeptide repeat protein [Pyrinomonadaceae bacterium]
MKSMKSKLTAVAAALLFASPLALAQSGATRPRRVTPSNTVPTPTPAASTADAGRPAAAVAAGAPASTARAFSLFQQKQYEAALREAKQVAAADPKNSEAWKLAGFAELELQQYEPAVADLQRAQELRRAEGSEDVNIEGALIRAYVSLERYEQALPLLVAATTRAGATPDPRMLYLRGLAELRTNKAADAERSFNAAVKADPKNAPALLYLGQLAFRRNDFTAAINMLNRATAVDAKLASAWELLAHSYLRRAAAAEGPKAEADNLAAVRASESLVRVRDDEESGALLGQSLIFANQYARAAAALERAAARPDAKGTTLYLLGFAHSRAKNFPKAIAALERAAAATPDNAEVYRELGFAAESSKQYAKALAAYERGLQLAPADEYFKESAERVRPFAK